MRTHAERPLVDGIWDCSYRSRSLFVQPTRGRRPSSLTGCMGRRHASVGWHGPASWGCEVRGDLGTGARSHISTGITSTVPWLKGVPAWYVAASLEVEHGSSDRSNEWGGGAGSDAASGRSCAGLCFDHFPSPTAPPLHRRRLGGGGRHSVAMLRATGRAVVKAKLDLPLTRELGEVALGGGATDAHLSGYVRGRQVMR